MADSGHIESPEGLGTKELDKLGTAGRLCQDLQAYVAKKCIVGADIKKVCAEGDEYGIRQAVGVYAKKEDGKAIGRGLAFPVCLSPNELGSNYRLYTDDAESIKAGATGGTGAIPYLTMNMGDLITAEMGMQVDGYACYGANSFIILPECSCTGEGKCDVCEDFIIDNRSIECLALAYAASCVLKIELKVGMSSKEVTQMLEAFTAGSSLKCSSCVNGREYKRFLYEGVNRMGNKQDGNTEQEVAAWNVKHGQTIAFDLAYTTGDGKGKPSSLKTNIYRRAPENKYILKSELARNFVGIIDSKYPTFPFSVNYIEDAPTAKRGVGESLRHGLIAPLPIMSEKPGDKIARFAFSVVVLASGKMKALSQTKDPFIRIRTLPNHIRSNLPKLDELFTDARIKNFLSHVKL